MLYIDAHDNMNWMKFVSSGHKVFCLQHFFCLMKICYNKVIACCIVQDFLIIRDIWIRYYKKLVWIIDESFKNKKNSTKNYCEVL